MRKLIALLSIAMIACISVIAVPAAGSDKPAGSLVQVSDVQPKDPCPPCPLEHKQFKITKPVDLRKKLHGSGLVECTTSQPAPGIVINNYANSLGNGNCGSCHMQKNFCGNPIMCNGCGSCSAPVVDQKKEMSGPVYVSNTTNDLLGLQTIMLLLIFAGILILLFRNTSKNTAEVSPKREGNHYEHCHFGDINYHGDYRPEHKHTHEHILLVKKDKVKATEKKAGENEPTKSDDQKSKTDQSGPAAQS